MQPELEAIKTESEREAGNEAAFVLHLLIWRGIGGLAPYCVPSNKACFNRHLGCNLP
jgi:hypothetical protein